MFNKPRLLTPGPTPLPESVRLALGRDMIHHRKHAFKELMLRVQPRLQALFGCSTPILPLACSGTGAMTAAVYSLFSPGQKVLVAEGGKFGERFCRIAAARGLEVARISVPWGRAVEPAGVLAALDAEPGIAGVLVQCCETSTGVLHPVGELGRAMAGRGALLVVDGVSAVGISPCPMEDWNIDCLLTGSQKGLLLPPGLALLALSPRAWAVAERTAPGCFYFNLPAERDAILKGQTNFTTPVNLVAGLEASLDILLGNGLEAVYRKQWALTMLCRAGVSAMGLRLFAPEHFAWGVTSVRLPEGIDGAAALGIAEKEYGVCMAGGQDAMKGRMARIGHMGWVDWSDLLAGLYALNRGLMAAGGYCAARDYLEKAMSAYNLALELGPGEMPGDAQIRS